MPQHRLAGGLHLAQRERPVQQPSLVATATTQAALTAFRFDVTAISGSSARATMSLARG